jgi:hypothetical protein
LDISGDVDGMSCRRDEPAGYVLWVFWGWRLPLRECTSGQLPTAASGHRSSRAAREFHPTAPDRQRCGISGKRRNGLPFRQPHGRASPGLLRPYRRGPAWPYENPARDNESLARPKTGTLGSLRAIPLAQITSPSARHSWRWTTVMSPALGATLTIRSFSMKGPALKFAPAPFRRNAMLYRGCPLRPTCQDAGGR